MSSVLSATPRLGCRVIGLEDTRRVARGGAEQRALDEGFRQMMRASRTRRPMWGKVGHALSRKRVYLAHHVHGEGAGAVAVTYVVGRSDRALIELARSRDGLGFPRGFAIIWSPWQGVLLRVAGFLSKFDNDAREEAPLSLEGATGCVLAKKYSGSLGLLAAFEHEGEGCVFFGAKNSTGNAYTRVFHDLLVGWYAEDAAGLDALLGALRGGRCVAFEVCSSDPRVGQHGARYGASFPVVLVIGETTEEAAIVRFLPDDEAMALARRLRLPVGSRWFVRDRAGFEAMVAALHARRDQLTNAGFDALIGQAVADGVVSEARGSVDHAALTDVLEGLVFWVWRGEALEITKYKLARYTRMTMCLRPLLLERVVEPGAPLCRFAVARAALTWARRWVVDPVERQRHVAWVLRACELIAAGPPGVVDSASYLERAEPAILQAEAEDPERDARSWIGPALRVVLVVGHVGSGKTTVIDALRAWGARGVVVDDLEENTGRKGLTKNNHAYGALVMGCLDGRVGAIENGGGLFFDAWRRVMGVVDELERRSPSPIEVAAVIAPAAIVGFDAQGEEEGAALGAALEAETLGAVEQRLARGAYVVDPARASHDPMAFQSVEHARGVFRKVTRRNLDSQLGLLRWARKRRIPVVGFAAAARLDGPPAITFDDEAALRGVLDAANPAVDPDGVTFTHGYLTRCVVDGRVYLGHVTCGFGVSYAEARAFLDAAEGQRAPAVSGRVLRIAPAPREAAGAQDEAATPRGGYLCVAVEDREDAWPGMRDHAHMTIDAPFRAISNREVVAAASERAIGERFTLPVDDAPYLVTRTAQRVAVEARRPYAYALPRGRLRG